MFRKPTIRPVPGRVLAGAVAVASLAALAACGGSGAPGAAPTATVTKTKIQSAPPSPTAPVTTPPADHGSPTPTSAGCATSALSIRPGQAQGTAGSIYLAIVFRNISQSSCTLYGFPGVALAGGHPVAQIGLAAQRSQSVPRLVTLAPGAAASALLQIVQAGNYSRSRCRPVASTYLQVYPPNQTTPAYVAYHTAACRLGIKLLTIGPAVAGTGGSTNG